MNWYAIVILGALLFDFVLELTADLLNISSLRDELPVEFSDTYDSEAYRTSQAYTRTTTLPGMAKHTCILVIVLAFWFTGGFNGLDTLVRSWNLPIILNGIIYCSIILTARSLLALPFSIISTFIIEERFGFNRTSPSTFIADLLKGVGLSVFIGGPLLAGVLALFEYGGDLAWLYSWIVVALASLFFQVVAPVVILPLFYTFAPVMEGALKESINAYTRSVHFPVSGIYSIDSSRRTSKTNAFFTGLGKNRRIALFDTLVEKHPVEEVVAVLAHEIGHYKKKHILKGTALSMLQLGVMFYLFSLCIDSEGLFRAFYMDRLSVYAGLIFFGLLYTPVELILSVLMNMLSRYHEYQADRFAAKTIDNVETFIHALKTLAVHNLSNLDPHPLYVFLHYSHPPLAARISALRENVS